MRESTVYNILNMHKKQIEQAVSFHFRLFGNAILDLAIYRETWECIVYSRKRLIWFIFLGIVKPIWAQDYFARLYSDNKCRRLEEEKKNLQAQVDAKKKEETCSGQKKEEIPKAGLQKEILTPNKQILGTDGRPIQSK